MKKVYVVGLIALVVLGFVAFTSTASATILCKTKAEGLCPAGERWMEKQSMQSALALTWEFKLVAGEVEFKCNDSSFKGETIKSEGPNKKLTYEVGVWSTSNKEGKECEAEGIKCPTAHWINLPYVEAGITPTAGAFGVLKIEKKAAYEFVCAGVKCIYGAEPLEVELSAGKGALWVINGKFLSRKTGSSIFCANSAALFVAYAISEPAGEIWVSKEP